MEKSKQKRKKKGEAKTRLGLTFAYAASLTAVILLVGGWCVWNYLSTPYKGESRWLYIPTGPEKEQIADSLATLDDEFGHKVFLILSHAPRTNLYHAAGAYKVDNGTTALQLARKLRRGNQTPVKVTFNNIRTMEQLCQRLGTQFESSADDFISAADTVMTQLGFGKAQQIAAFFPDTYEFYWTERPPRVFKKLAAQHDKFWNESRMEKARKLNLSPMEVTTLASIVEEETNKADERPIVARLYLNRLAKDMPLQADPTVKFATGDFSLRRINKKHLEIRSPYNTYLNKGLPPGPIRMVNRQTIDDVLDAPKHNYLYMCAKEDFSGYHNFAVDFATHQANARRYQAELNRRGIR
ncbi:MAG: endolytic transglycosylase MltG [Muribaculaceae bacterium]|nr:endolytic transglycosylase MltG [Muribaculaceae bacterium]